MLERARKGVSLGTAGKPASETRLTELLSSLKRKSYVTMCEHLEAEGMVGMVDQRVAGLLREWLASRMTGLNEETRVIAQRIIDEPVVWVVHGWTVSGGKTECCGSRRKEEDDDESPDDKNDDDSADEAMQELTDETIGGDANAVSTISFQIGEKLLIVLAFVELLNIPMMTLHTT